MLTLFTAGISVSMQPVPKFLKQRLPWLSFLPMGTMVTFVTVVTVLRIVGKFTFVTIVASVSERV
jgi:hypothetical protein